MAIVDCGSNTFRLVVFEYRDGGPFTLVDEVRESVRISAGETDGVLAPPALERASRAARLFSAVLRGAGVEEAVTVATSAIRDARNQAEVLALLRRSGLDVRVLDEDEETWYGYLGAVNSTTLRDGAVLDIGGGSLQVSQVRDRHLIRGASRPLGAVRMTERFVPEMPTPRRQVRALERHIESVLGELGWIEEAGGRLVAIGGALRTVARIDQKRVNYPVDELHGYVLTAEALDEVIEMVRPTSGPERRRLPGLKSDRSDITLAGAVAARVVMRMLGVTRMEICGQGLREGLFYERFLAPASPPLIADVRRETIRNIGGTYGYDHPHADQVALLAVDTLLGLVGAGLAPDDPWEREMLWAASKLHDVGKLVDYNDHHKHGHYLVMSSGLPGYDHRELAMITLLVRSHRKRLASPGALGALLARGDVERLRRLAACLRLAESLERTRDRSVQGVRVRRVSGGVEIEVTAGGDPDLAVWSAAGEAADLGRALRTEVHLVGRPAGARGRRRP